jgi:hypothetical protein
MFESILVNTDNIRNGTAPSYYLASKPNVLTNFIDRFTIRLNTD